MRELDIETFQEYWERTKPITDEYFELLPKIERDWSVMYNMKTYTGKVADNLEKNCKRSIDLFERWHQIDIEYDQLSPLNVPCLKRLAMLYEKQGDYEKSINVCKIAVDTGVNISDAKPRMVRMIKKARRKPTDEEMKIIESD